MGQAAQACCVSGRDPHKDRDLGLPKPIAVKMCHECDFVNLATGEHLIEAIEGKFVHGRSLSLKTADALHAEDDIEESVDMRKASINLVQNPLARAMFERIETMLDELAQEEDMLHSSWDGPQGRDPLSWLFGSDDSDKIAVDFIQLNAALMEELKSDSSLNRVSVPAKVFGDIHGQLRDLLLFLLHFGMPGGDETPNFVFNGDWVDRGRHQIEVLTVVYTLKLAFPSKVWLNRGNHEDGRVNSHAGEHGFEHACSTRFGEDWGAQVFRAATETFEYLPLGSVLGGTILVVHGGIGEGNWKLEHLENAPRPLDDAALEADHVFYNVLWSDPIHEDKRKSFGVHESPRDGHMGLILGFGHDVTKRFLTKNGLAMIIRSHESNEEGDGYELMHDGHLARCFSARDYEGNTNDGSIMFIQEKEGMMWVRPQVLHSFLKQR